MLRRAGASFSEGEEEEEAKLLLSPSSVHHHDNRMFSAGWKKVFVLLQGDEVVNLCLVGKTFYEIAKTLTDADWREMCVARAYPQMTQMTWKSNFEYNYSRAQRIRRAQEEREEQKKRYTRQLQTLLCVGAVCYVLAGVALWDLPWVRRGGIVSGSVALSILLLRMLRRDIRRYDHDEYDPDAIEEEDVEWKLVHGEVYRHPRRRYVYFAARAFGVGVLTWLAFSSFFALIRWMTAESYLCVGPALVSLLFGLLLAVKDFVSAKCTGEKRCSKQLFYLLPVSLPFLFLLFFPLSSSSSPLSSSSVSSSQNVWSWTFSVCIFALLCRCVCIHIKTTYTWPPLRVNMIPRILVPASRLSYLSLISAFPALAQTSSFAKALQNSSSSFLTPESTVIWELFWLCVELGLLCVPVMGLVVIYGYLNYGNYDWWWPCLLLPTCSTALCFVIVALFSHASWSVYSLWLFCCSGYCVAVSVGALCCVYILRVYLFGMYRRYVD